MLAVLSDNIVAILGFVIGGGLATGIAQLVKALADAKKTTSEAKKLDMTLSSETETITVATMKEAIQTMRDLAADANTSRERAERNETALRARLDALEAQNRELSHKVERLEADDRSKNRELDNQRHRIGRLENNLGTARAEAHRLAAALREVGIDPDPPVDFSIFDV